jgi:hypothetical protein
MSDETRNRIVYIQGPIEFRRKQLDGESIRTLTLEEIDGEYSVLEIVSGIGTGLAERLENRTVWDTRHHAELAFENKVATLKGFAQYSVAEKVR